MDAVSLRQSGREAYKKGEFDLATTYYRRALDLKPDDYELVNKLGSVLFLQSNFAAAAKVYSDAIARMNEQGEEGESLGNMHISLAEVYLNLHCLEDAKAQLEIADQTGATLAFLREAQGRGYNATGEYDKALVVYQEYGYLGIATAYQGLKQYSRATETLQIAKSLGGDDYWVEIALGNLAMTTENYADALNHYKLASELDARKPAVIFSMGRAYLMMEDYANARKSFSLALERRPNDVGSIHGLAQVEIVEGNVRQGIALLKSAIMIEPSNHSYYTLLVQAQATSGKWLDALRTSLQARKLFKSQKTQQI